MSHLVGHAQVSLHPVASRHGTVSSTLVSLPSPPAESRHPNQSRDEPSDREDGQGTPRLQRSSPQHQGSRPVPPRSPSPTSLPQAAQTSTEPSTYGIHHADLDLYPIIYDEPLPSDSSSSDDDEADDLDKDTFDDGFGQRRSSRSASSPRRPRLSKRKLAAPIRLMSAEQLSRLHDQYVEQDVPHHIVFPYLHGVDGSIPAQNRFFGAPLSGQPTPAYRGLTIVRAEMPSRQEAERLSASSKTSYIQGRARGRTFSSITTQSSGSSPDTDEESARFEPSWANGIKSPPALQLAASTLVDPAPISPASTASMSPSTASTVSSQVSRPSLFSVTSESYSSGSRTSVSTVSDMADDCAGAPGKDFDMYATRYYLQPSTSLLNSTVFPEEIINPPSLCRTMYGRNIYSDLSEANFGDARDTYAVRRIGATFVNPPQASGVSLRNFKIQNAKYATISDIVIYCPFGYHSGVLQLASMVREAQASLRKERLSRGWGGLQYNVFVVTEPFKVFEEQFPNMVAVDSKGSDRNRIDFVEREGDEMQRMARASEIHDNVWLGSVFDRPDVAKRAPWGQDGGDDSAPVTPDERDERYEQGNPHSFSICINCSEDRLPWSSGCTPKVLRNAAQYLDSVEASMRIDSETDKLLDSLHRDQLFPLDGSATGDGVDDAFRNPSSRDGSIVLGPNGWTPKPRSIPVGTDASASHFLQTKISNASLGGARNDRSDGGVLRIGANYAVQLDFQTESGGASRPGWNDRMAEKLVNLCVWIHQQASPQDPPPSDRAAPKFNSISSTLRTFRDAARSSTRSFSPNRGRERTSHRRDEARSLPAQLPRRVLLHCHDGYTETSTLALSYLMYARELSLPEAYLDLQLRANRSFFVYPADVAVLEVVDQLLQRTRAARRASMPEPMDVSPDVRRSRHAASKSFSGPLVASGRRTEERRLSLSVTAPTISGLVDGGLSPVELAGGGICRTSTPTPTKCRTGVVEVDADGAPETHGWFNADRFDGSFPSRILPFLYLGNLDHASNVDMLGVLGITHLVSVGETALEPPAHISAKVNSSRKDHGRSRYQRASAKAALAEDPSTVPSCTYQSQGVTVLNVRNVSDDGIDSLRGTMREAVQFIEAVRLSGGKVLVHCRVGVSRSTTIVLAYVMAHLDLGLVESYLLVRSRRLNIVIQPHLLFLWELRGWEMFLCRAKQAQIKLLCGRLDSPDVARGELPREASNALSALSIRSGGSGSSTRSDEGSGSGSGSYRSAWSSPAGSPVAKSTAPMVDAVVGCCTQQWGEEHLPGVEIGAGAGSIHGVDMAHAAMLPFGSGSPTGLSYKVSRLTWGFLAREIADLNSRYFV
ncbi:related to protein tyrosine phosphatase PPS1 [Sporisorium scitamineum]|uniref:Related to protein tyrosine phosphatase PPS1 n=1 Tax=Sporisorium scitamineum TaxID=49012 RepID=A0A0F7S848_9BASI|nr:related to protein tyrosine phosphatase PPS1 [Sporisorium scitamineum]CDW96883.1 hypothetical protein [Sporisorium scitamineum]